MTVLRTMGDGAIALDDRGDLDVIKLMSGNVVEFDSTADTEYAISTATVSTTSFSPPARLGGFRALVNFRGPI